MTVAVGIHADDLPMGIRHAVRRHERAAHHVHAVHVPYGNPPVILMVPDQIRATVAVEIRRRRVARAIRLRNVDELSGHSDQCRSRRPEVASDERHGASPGTTGPTGDDDPIDRTQDVQLHELAPTETETVPPRRRPAPPSG